MNVCFIRLSEDKYKASLLEAGSDTEGEQARKKYSKRCRNYIPIELLMDYLSKTLKLSEEEVS